MLLETLPAALAHAAGLLVPALLPAALPRVFTGVRFGAVAALLVVLAVEAVQNRDVVSLTVLVLLGVATVAVVRRMEQRVLAWR